MATQPADGRPPGDGLKRDAISSAGNARYDTTPRRVEHWSMPGDTARHAARTLVAFLSGSAVDQPAFAPLPTFWSDQYGQRLQAIGAPQLGTDDVRLLEGDLRGDVIVGYHHDGRLIGVVGFGGPRTTAATARYRATLSTSTEPSQVRGCVTHH